MLTSSRKNRLLLLTVGFLFSLVAPALAQTVATPSISIASGISYAQYDATITDSTSGASIYYTLDGTTPTTSSAVVVSGNVILMCAGQTLNVKAFKAGLVDSAVATATEATAPQISAGEYHSTALKSDGTVWACGHNGWGQIGDGTTVFAPNMKQISGLSGMVMVSGNHYFTLALKNDGTVYAWGQNNVGQIGDGTVSDRHSPVHISSAVLNNIVAVSSDAGQHSLALRSDGTVWAWGWNSKGQLGDGTTTDRHTPFQISGLSGIVAISAGYQHSLALKSDGTLYAWGSNSNGQLGDGTTADRYTPQVVSGFTVSGVPRTITGVSGGANHTVVCDNTGQVWAWGYNSDGEVGNGTTTEQHSPVLLTTTSNVVAVSAGNTSNMALDTSGNVWSWGGNTWFGNIDGQLGVGAITLRTSPAQISGISNIVAISVGGGHALTMDVNGVIRGCGLSTSFQLGNGPTIMRSTPVQVLGLSGVIQATSMRYHKHVVTNAGIIWGWGGNYSQGYLGDGTTIDRYNPVQALYMSGMTTVSAGDYFCIGLKNNGAVYTWGSDGAGEQDKSVYSDFYTGGLALGFSGVTLTQVGAGGNHGIALDSTGHVWGWGLNSSGQLGNGTTTGTGLTGPIEVKSSDGASYLSGITAISVGEYYSTALDSSGHVWVWGLNANGQLGDGTTTNRTLPYQLGGAIGSATIVKICAGPYHVLALDSTGHVWAWGYNGNGQLGDGTTTQRTTPIQISSLNSSGIVDIGIGGYHSLALASDGTVWAWGYNSTGQLGDGTTTQRTSPQHLSSLKGIVSVAGDLGSSMAVKEDGTVTTWGDNIYGDLGTGGGPNLSLTLTPIPGLNLIQAPPSVSITTPSNNSTSPLGQALSLQVTTTDTSGTVNRVDYYNERTLIGSSTTSPFSVTWTPSTWGAYNITAIATNNQGARSAYATSVAVTVPYDSDSNTLPDWWELSAFGTLGNSASADSDNDGLTNLQEYQQRSNPTNYYSQGSQTITPTLTKVSGDSQTSNPSAFAPQALLVQVINSNGGAALNHAPVTFTVTSGGGLISATSGGSTSTSLQVQTNASGQALIYFQQPATGNTTSQISASTGGQTVTFSEISSGIVATPVLSPTSGMSYAQFNVTVTDSTSGAKIYYTLDGTTPTTSSAFVSAGGTILISKSGTLKAKGVLAGYGDSTVATATYQVTGQVSVGTDYTLLLKSNGTLWVSGNNVNTQLGLTTSVTSTSTMTQAGSTLSGVVQVSAGVNGNLVLQNTGTVSKLAFTNPGGKAIATVWSGLSVIAVSSGFNHGLLLKSDGTVWAWGTNSTGQYGNGNTTTTTSLTQVSGLTGVTAISAGNGFSLALKSNGTVWAWGLNSNGQLGDTTTTQRTTAVQVSGLTGIVDISAGNAFGVALKNDGTVWTWGLNSSGQLGDTTTTQRTSPVQVSGLTSVVDISSGYAYASAIKSDSTVWSWGDNTYGQQGAGKLNASTSPVQMSGMIGASVLAAGTAHTMVIKNDGTVWGCGNNNIGQQGNGSLTAKRAPLQLLGLTSVASLSSGVGNHTLTVKSDGTLWAFGENIYGELGDGTTNQPSIPQQVPSLTGIMSAGVGAYHSLAVKSDGTVWAWGLNTNGQLGDGTTTQRLTPVQVSTVTSISKASGGASHSIALKSDGTVWTWGLNSNGQLGDATTTQRTSPVQVTTLSGISAVGAGVAFSVALKSDGTVWAWGLNTNGQVGDGSTTQRTAPVQVLGLTGVTAISVGNDFAYARKSDGTVWAWGSNVNGQLSLSTSTTQSTTPVQVSTVSSVTAIYAGGAFGMALGSTGSVWTWGANNNGQLGNGSTTTTSNTPAVIASSGITAIGGGIAQGIMLKNDATLYIWGDNSLSQLGVTPNYSICTPIPGLNSLSTALIPTVSTLTIPSTTVGIGQTVTLTATATETGGTISSVQLYINSIWIGQATSAPFTLSWTPATWGNFVFTAIAVDSLGQTSARSAELTVSTPSTNTDSDSNGLPDWWETQNFSHLGVDPNADPDGDGLTNLQEFQQASNPNNYYSQGSATITGTVSLISGNNQISPGGAFAPLPLVIKVTNATTGAILTNAPVIFQGSSIATSSGGATSGSISTVTDNNGLAQVYYQQSTIGNYSNTITARTNNGGGSSVSFNETSTIIAPVWSPAYAQSAIPFSVSVNYPNYSSATTTYFTTDGSMPQPVGSTSYGLVTQSETFSAKAWSIGSPGQNSATATGIYQITGNVALGGGNVYVLKTPSLFGWGNATLYPTAITSVTNVYAVAAGDNFTGVVLSDGTIKTWGGNSSGQLGNGTTTDSATPVLVSGLAGATAVLAGSTHTLALVVGGGVYAWGNNAYGQLGNGTTTNSSTPVSVSTPSGIVQLIAKNNYSLALAADQTVYAWGYNGHGELGNNTTTNSPTPAQISGLTNVVFIAGGGSHAVAAKSDGTVWAWGDNTYGQLGTGNTTSSLVPVQVVGLTGVVAVAAGDGFSVAVKSDGTVWAWGDNTYGELGNNSTASSLSPVQTGPFNDSGATYTTMVTEVMAASHTLLAITNNGAVFSWGANDAHQLANGGTTPSLKPTLMGMRLKYTLLDQGQDGIPDSWQSSTSGSYGAPYGDADGDGFNNLQEYLAGSAANNYYSQPSSTAINPQVTFVSGNNQTSVPGGFAPLPMVARITYNGIPMANAPVTLILSGQPGAGMSATSGGTVSTNFPTSTDANGLVQAYFKQPTSANITSQIYLSFPPTVGGFTSGGSDHFTELSALAAATPTATPADGSYAVAQTVIVSSTTPSATIYYTLDGTDPTTASPSVASGGTILITHSETLKLKAVATGSSLSATASVVYSITPAISSVGAGTDHTLLVKSDGTLKAWGRNQYGQLGLTPGADITSPTAVPGITQASRVATSDSHTLVLNQDGTVLAFGDNYFGQLGDGTTTDNATPQAISGLSSIIAIAAGEGFSVALKSDGTVYTWGSNAKGQLGQNDQVDRAVPTQVSGLTNIAAISAGRNFVVALTSTGTLKAWGANQWGQIGDGTTTTRLAPVAISGVSAINAIATGANHALAVDTSGTLWAWGENTFAQAGDSSLDTKLSPQSVAGVTGAKSVAAGWNHSLVTTTAQSLLAFGANDEGQLGDGTFVDKTAPTLIPSVVAVGVAAGADHSAIGNLDYALLVTGRNLHGQLGDGTTVGKSTPTSTIY